jgi:chromosome segregation ATPase
MILMSMSKELESLRNTRTKLEEESHSLSEKQKNLEEKIAVLEENITIERLRNSNKAASDAIAQLESKISEMEQKLKDVSKGSETSIQTFETRPEVATTSEPEQVTAETVKSVPEEPVEEEETVTVIPFEEPILADQEEDGENLKKQHEKKKRKYF